MRGPVLEERRPFFWGAQSFAKFSRHTGASR